jgi:drug/metabolite transporter (DMT)-like permease
MPLALLALVSTVVASARRAKWSPQILRDSLWIGLGLFALPALLIAFSQTRTPPATRAALLTLVPVFTVVFEPYIGSSSPSGRGMLTWFLAFLGAMLVFPLTLPGSIESSLAFVAVILAASSIGAANCLAASCITRSPANAASLARIAAIAAASSIILLVAASAIFERSFWTGPGVSAAFAAGLPWTAALDLPALLLLFWLMPRLSAPALATRYILAPLFAILAAIAFLGLSNSLQLRNWIGLILMASGAARLILAPAEEKSITLNSIP